MVGEVVATRSLVDASRELMTRVQERKENSRRQVSNSLSNLEASCQAIRRSLEDGLPFRQRTTAFGSLGSSLDAACRELSVSEEQIEEIEEVLETEA